MIFTESHRRHLDEHGYVRIPDVIPRSLTERVLAALPEMSSVRYADSATWYDYPFIIPSHHHQTQWDLRQCPQLHQTFAELWGDRSLWVTMDRIGMVPPFRPGCREPRMHWDRDPRLTCVNYQAIVYLTDAPADRAPFCALPQVYRHLDDWVSDKPPEWSHRGVDFSREEMTKVPGQAGDLVVWDARLPHGPGENRSREPRLMQAVSLFPAPRRGGGWPGNRDFSREEQIEWWQTKRAPPWWRNVPQQRDPEPGPPARLTALGRRLVGLDSWD